METEDQGTTALLLIDLQRDFLETKGRMPVGQEDAERVIDAARRLLRHANLAGWKQVFIRNEFHRSDWLGNLLRKGAAIKDSAGAEFDPRVPIPATAAVVSKSQADAFGNPALEPMLREAAVRRIVVLGVMTEACVRATTKGAIRRGINVTVVSDAVASSRRLLHRIGLRSMRKAGASLLQCSQIVAAPARGRH